MGWKLCDCRFFAIKWYWQNPQSLSCQPNISFFTLTRQFLRVISLFGIIGLMINYSLLTKSHLFWMKRSIWSPCRKRCRLCAQWVTFLKHIRSFTNNRIVTFLVSWKLVTSNDFIFCFNETTTTLRELSVIQYGELFSINLHEIQSAYLFVGLSFFEYKEIIFYRMFSISIISQPCANHFQLTYNVSIVIIVHRVLINLH